MSEGENFRKLNTDGLEFKTRKPVTSEAEKIDLDRAASEWHLLTKEIIRQDVHIPGFESLISQEPDESMAIRFVDGLEHSIDPAIQNIMKESHSNLSALLQIPEVPKEQMEPTIQHAPELVNPEKVKKRFMYLAQHSNSEESMAQLQQQMEQQLDYYEKNDLFKKGLSNGERLIAYQRTLMARDIKLLALKESLREKPEFDEFGRTELNNGIQIQAHPERVSEIKDLLDVSQWQGRKFIRSRVHRIKIGDKYFILKEKKTPYHQGLFKHTHQEPLNSSDEFQLAIKLEKEGRHEEEGLIIRWETPVAAVTFPDGFQMVIFDHEDGLVPKPRDELKSAIFSAPEAYEKEYKEILKKIPEYMNHPLLQKLTPQAEVNNATAWQKLLGKFKPAVERKINEISFARFAELKTMRVFEHARNKMDEILANLKVRNLDRHDYEYRLVTNDDGTTTLEMIVLDLEYFDQNSDRAVDSGDESVLYGIESQLRNLKYLNERAALLAMVEDEGQLL